MPLRVVHVTMKFLTNYVHNTKCLFDTMYKSVCIGVSRGRLRSKNFCTVWIRFKPNLNPNFGLTLNVWVLIPHRKKEKAP